MRTGQHTSANGILIGDLVAEVGKRHQGDERHRGNNENVLDQSLATTFPFVNARSFAKHVASP
jgi:hypothetical protein